MEDKNFALSQEERYNAALIAIGEVVGKFLRRDPNANVSVKRVGQKTYVRLNIKDENVPLLVVCANHLAVKEKVDGAWRTVHDEDYISLSDIKDVKRMVRFFVIDNLGRFLEG